jgi:hypothetical protein
MSEQQPDQRAIGERMVRLLAIARGLEDEGQYNVAKLFRATAYGAGVRATLDRPRPNSGLYEAMDAVIAELREVDTGAPIGAMEQALATLRAGGFPTQEEIPATWACRHCGQVMLDEPPEVCPNCRARRLTFQPFPAVWYNVPMSREEILEALAANLADVRQIADGVSEAQADTGEWPFRAILAHLLGSEALLAGRAVRMLEEDEPLFISVDPNEIGSSEEETPPTIAAILEDLIQARQATISRFSALDPNVWHRAGTHPEFGRMSVTQQLAYLVRHEQWHLAELEERARD